MKKLFLCFLVTLLINFAQAQKPDGEPYMVKSFSNESIQNAVVKTSGGSISVNAVSSGPAKVEVYIHANSGNRRGSLSEEEIQKRLDEQYELTIGVSNGKLSAIAKSKNRNRNWKNSLSIAFRLYVPENISTDLTTSGGSISLEGISGSQQFMTSGGSLNVDHVSGKINGKTSGGSINVVNSTDEIDLTTSGGSINATDCEGRLRLTTSGGSLNLSNLKGDIRAVTSGGSIHGGNIGGELETHTSGGGIHLENLRCSLEASTSSGTITVSMKELGKYVRITNSSGNINLQLPKDKGLDLDLSANRISAGRLDNFKGRVEEHEIEGTLSGGGIPVNVKTSSGRISIEFN